MKILLVTSTLFSLLLSLCTPPISKSDTFNVLVFSKTAGFRHQSIPAGKAALLKMGMENNFTVDTTEDASFFNSNKLGAYKAVVFLNTTLDVLNEAQQADFEQYIKKGGGYVGIHSATDTEYDWPWYGKLAGAYFNGHPAIQEAVFQVVDQKHDCTKHLPASWKRTDELYNYKNINPDLNVLLNLDESSYEGGTNGENHPIAWYHEFDGGRAFYTGLGHTIESYSEPLFLEHVLRGIMYAAGR